MESRDKFSMRTSLIGTLTKFFYRKNRIGRTLLAWSVSTEGGEMTSQTLRSVLGKHYGVAVGNYSYGSLLSPGHSDAGTEIGSYVSVGPNVRRFGAAHPLESGSLHPYFYNPKLGFVDSSRDVKRTACTIGHDSWIGANTLILPGCSRIGVGAVIGAGSVVTRDVPDFAVVVGSPAKIIKYRFSEAERNELIKSKFWELSPRQLSAYLGRMHQVHSDESTHMSSSNGEEPTILQ